MTELNEEITTTQGPKDEQPSHQKEEYPDTNARDLFHPTILQEFSERLKGSNGKAFICVHPFYLVRSSYKNYLPDVMNGLMNAPEEKRFWTDLGRMLPKLVEAKAPIVFLQEITYLGDSHHAGEAETIQSQHQILRENLGQITDISGDDCFVIYTERASPYPLKTVTEESLDYKALIIRRMEALKAAGLKIAILAGGKLEPSEKEPFEYYENAESIDWGWSPKDRLYQSVYGDWRLKDLFDKKKGAEAKHALQVIRLDNCLGEFARMLGFNGIYPAVSRLTYPERLRKVSEYEPIEFGGKTVYK